jgi:hypothetical protein
MRAPTLFFTLALVATPLVPAAAAPLPLVPRIDGIDPSHVTVGSPDTVIHITGSGFTSDDPGILSRVYANGELVPRTVVDASHIDATLEARWFERERSISLVVANGLTTGPVFAPLLFSNSGRVDVERAPPKPAVALRLDVDPEQSVRSCFYVRVEAIDEDGSPVPADDLSVTVSSDDPETLDAHDGRLIFFSDYCTTPLAGPFDPGFGSYLFARATERQDVVIEGEAGELRGTSGPIHVAGGYVSGAVATDAGPIEGVDVSLAGHYASQGFGVLPPVAKAYCAVFAGYPRNRYSYPSDPRLDGPLATSAADGTFRSAAVAPGTYRVFFGAPSGLASQWLGGGIDPDASLTVEVTDGAETSALSAHLVEGGTIAGRVTGADGAGLAGARVLLEDPATREVLAQTEAGSDGTYRSPGLPVRAYNVRFRTDTFAYVPMYYRDVFDRREATPVPVSAGTEAAGVDGSLSHGAVIGGAVSAPDDDVFAVVTVHDVATGTERASGFATADGFRTSPGLPPGDYRVHVVPIYPDDYIEGWYGGDTFADAVTVSLHRDEERTIDVSLERGATITGTVRGGMPLVGSIELPGPVLARAEVYDTDTGERAACGYTDGDGVLRTPGLPAGRYLLRIDPTDGDHAPVWYPHAASRSGAEVITLARGETRAVHVEVDHGASIRGHITDPDGRAVPHVDLLAFADGERSIFEDGVIGADGSFAFAGLAPGSYRMVAYGYDEQWRPLATTWYPDAATRAQATPVVVTGTEQLDASFAFGVPSFIAGAVSGVDDDAYTSVTFLDPATKERAGWATVEGNGTFTSSPLHAGTYIARFTGPRSRAQHYFGGSQTAAGATPVSVAAGSTASGVDVTMRTGHAIQGTVRASHSDAEMPGVYVSVADPVTGERIAFGYTREDGTYVTSAVEPGDYKVAFDPHDGIFAVQWFREKDDFASADTVGVAGEASGIDARLRFLS